MFKYIATMALLGAFNANAMRCETDQECFDQSIRLIKRAQKQGVCASEVKRVLAGLTDIMAVSDDNKALEACLKAVKGKK
jgi:hypothetical protein